MLLRVEGVINLSFSHPYPLVTVSLLLQAISYAFEGSRFKVLKKIGEIRGFLGRVNQISVLKLAEKGGISKGSKLLFRVH